MSLFAQHGYGKSNKLESALYDGSIAGVIFSPKDENMTKLADYVSLLHASNPTAHLLFDPQFYVSTIPNPNEGRLLSYPYYKSRLTRRDFSKSANITQYIKETLDYQNPVDFTHLISPSIIVDSFNDPWSQIAITLADEAINYYTSASFTKPLYISLCFNETALDNTDALNEFLDMISLLDVYGFYIIVVRNTSTPQILTSHRLENLMYLCYVLSTINQYNVIIGYGDLLGLPLYATGVNSISSGWFKSLKSFSINRFQPSTGGRPARPRYTSSSLINSILINPEMDTIYRQGLISNILSNTPYDSSFLRNMPSNVTWTSQQSILHHWMVLHNHLIVMDQLQTISEKFNYIERILNNASQIYSSLELAHVVFEQSSSSAFINEWQTAIQNFRHNIGV